MPITPLSPLDRTSPTFRADTNLFFGTKLPAFSVEVEAARVEIGGNAASAAASASAAAASATAAAASSTSASAVALASANFKGTYASLTGALNKPASVSHLGGYWMLLSNLTDVTTKVPGTATEWQRIDGPPAMTTTALAVKQLASGECVILSNAAAQAAGTNQFVGADDMTNGAWVSSGCTPSANVGTDSEGNQIADKWVESSGGAVRYFYQVITTAANVARCVSFVVEASGRSTFVISTDRDSGSDYNRASFDLSTGLPSGAVSNGTGSGAVATMVHLGANKWLCSLAGTPSTTAGTTVRTVVYLNLASTYTGDGASGLLFSQAQSELGTVVTSRIKTTTGAVTRSSGVVAPQRVVAPPNPAEGNWFDVGVGNGIPDNVVALNGKLCNGKAGPIRLDNATGNYRYLFANGEWRQRAS